MQPIKKLMKSNAITMMCILAASLCHAQEKNVYAETLARLSLKADSLSGDEYAAFNKKHFQREIILLPYVRYFKADHLLISLQENSDHKFDRFSFQNKYDFYKGLERWPTPGLATLVDTTVVQAGNAQYLVVRFHLLGEAYLSFFSELYNTDKYLFGKIKCRAEDIPSAREFLKTILPEP
ncbi:hypothetical protein [Chitinophaga sp.]|uniref:hypothetical protein n=1 Tax=Chitinophaga sp. TaxID=1869181 RepID=UPI002609FF28|nr:hypothetical protein [uncultured Chitinophaga sp.]